MTNCCIPGCTNYYLKTLDAVSYMRLPPDNPKNQEWRKAFIQVVLRYRTDKFNLKKAAICSEHFPRNHLLFHGKGFRIAPGRLPTLNLPTKSVTTEPTAPRKAPAERPVPAIPEVVKYFDISEVRRHFDRVEGWAYTNTADSIVLLRLDGDQEKVLKKICIEADLSYKITSLGVDVTKNVPRNLQNDGLAPLCRAVEALPTCRKCGGAVKEKGESCSKCRKSAMKAALPLKLNTPLSSATREQLEAEVRRLRRTAIKRKIAAEVVHIQEDVHVQ